MRSRWTSTLWLLGSLALAYGVSVWVTAIGGPAEVDRRFGWLAPLMTGLAQVILVPTPFPTDFICIAHGALYGFWSALCLNWLAWWVGAMISAALGRRLGNDAALVSRHSRAPAWLRRFPVGHPVFLIAARQVPWLGGHLTAFLPGALGVPLPRIAWCAAVSIVPGAAIMAGVGAGLLSL